MRKRHYKKLFRSEIKKVSLGENDMVILKHTERLSHSDFMFIYKNLKDFFPNNKVMIIDGLSEINIVSEE